MTKHIDLKHGATFAATSQDQGYWDFALTYFNNGDASRTAIKKLWSKMLPPASLEELARIVGAIWADTYWNWNIVRMDANELASDLQKVLGLNRTDCQKAATSAFSRWCGLLVRDTVSDPGTIPQGGYATSPDVVVNTAEVGLYDLIREWDKYIYDPNPGLKNYAYGRAQSMNIQVPISKPVVRMYFSAAGFNQPPTSWTQLVTYDEQRAAPLEGEHRGAIKPGERVANSDPFKFDPPGAGHYCLMTTAGTEFFTNDPLQGSGSNWNSATWLLYNGAAAMRNMNVSSASVATLKFYNQDGRPEAFVIEAHCNKVPAGTEVSLECEHPELKYAIKAHTKIAKDYQIVSVEAELPPHFVGDLKVQFKTPNGKLLPGGSSIDVRMVWHIPHGHPHYFQAAEQLGMARAFSAAQPIRLGMGSFMFLGSNG